MVIHPPARRKTNPAISSDTVIRGRQPPGSGDPPRFDPEIAKSRAQEAATEEQKKTIVDACKLWLARTRLQHQVKMRTDGLPISHRERSKNGGTLPQYQVLFGHLQRWAKDKGIIHIQEITPLLLEEWRTSDDWSRLAVTTQQQRWGVLRSFFAYLQGLKVIDSNPIAGIKAITVTKDHLQGPYSDEQIDSIFASVEASVPQRSDKAERVVYAQRLTRFLQLLLHTGCDVIDAVLFEPSRIEDVTLEGQVVPVYRYRRKKTKVGAVIPLALDVATSLRNVPVVTNKPNMPFKSRGTTIEYCAQVWSQRVDRCLEAAQVFYVELPASVVGGAARSRPANTKQFRHTFAVRQLIAGQRVEDVSKMLGHTDDKMIRKHYSPWVKGLEDAHLLRVLEVRSQGRDRSL